MKTEKTKSKAALWSGRIIMWLCILFLLIDAIIKVVKATPSVEGSLKLGWPEDMVQNLGIVLLFCTILYMIPRTAVLGAILLTAYLGGAVAIMVKAGELYYFPIIFCMLVWGSILLLNERLRLLIL